jgi:hypothetical protein
VPKTFKQKLSSQCEHHTENAEKSCKKAYNSLFENCFQKAPYLINLLICWPLKVDYVCNFKNLFSISNLCNPSSVIDASFEEEFIQLKEIGNQFKASGNNISINYTTSNSDDIVAFNLINETSRVIKNDVSEKQNWLYVSIRRILFLFMTSIALKAIYGMKRLLICLYI